MKEKNEEGGRQGKEGTGKLHIHKVFNEHLVRSLIQPTICIMNCPACNGH